MDQVFKNTKLYFCEPDLPLFNFTGRMTLLITLFLVLINIFINVTTTSPNTESLTSLSAWIITCILFLSCTLLEYGCILLYKYVIGDLYYDVFEYHQSEDMNGVDQINVVNKNSKKSDTPNIFGRNIIATPVRLPTANPGEPNSSEKKEVLRMDHGKKYLKKFDLLSLSTSVVSFIIFNIIFWNVQSYHI